MNLSAACKEELAKAAANADGRLSPTAWERHRDALKRRHLIDDQSCITEAGRAFLRETSVEVRKPTLPKLKLGDTSPAGMLVHQTQPTPYTCVHTCIAMLLGRPVADVMDEVKELAGMSTRDLLNALRHYDVMHAMTAFGALWTGWQFVTVPSLNVRGGAHQILVYWEPGKYRVLDPSPNIRYAEDGSDLNSWHDVILVRPPNRPTPKLTK